MTEFEFVKLPESHARDRRAGSLLFEYAEALKRRPGEWAVWPRPVKFPHPIASGINNRRGKNPRAFDGPGFEACVYQEVLHVRWVGVDG